MGRKPNPKGKDRPRSICLDGDVSELAQKLADKSQLSSVLSQLLRQNYGISDELSQLEQALSVTIDERKNLQQKEATLIEEIEAARDALIHRQNHILPSLYQRQGVLETRLEDLRLKLNYLPQNEAIKVMNQIDETRKLLETVLEDIKELEK